MKGIRGEHPLHPRSRQRRGFTLMEMLVVISAMTAVSVTGALLVGLLMSAENQGARAIVQQQTIARIGRQLRSDAHAATAVALIAEQEQPDAALVLTQLDGSEIRWQAGQDAVLREVKGNVDSSAPQRETYRLPEGVARFQFDAAADLIEFTHEAAHEPLTDSYSAQAPPGAVRIWKIQAAVGIDQLDQLDEPQN